jgi:capsular exopolysaccharide synthesis family protein
VHLSDYLRILAKRWLLIATCAGLSVGAAAAVTLRSTPEYATSITLYVSTPNRPNDMASAYDASLFAQQQVQSYVDLLASQRVAAQLARQLADGLTPQQLQGKISASLIPQTALLQATVTDTSRHRALRIASALGPVFARVVSELERPTTGGPSPVRVTVVDDATLPGAPVSPRPDRNLLLGLLLGLLIGAAAAILRDTLDTSVTSEEQLRDLTGSPVLGVVGVQSKTVQQLMARGYQAPRAEAYRSLRTNLQFVHIDRPLKSVTITSALAGEGKSITACNLAFALTDSGRRVALIEGDLRRPSLRDYLGVKGSTGLTDVLVGAAELDEAMLSTRNPLLSVLPCGRVPPNPSELLGTARMHDLLTRIQQDVDIVLIDSPPLLPVSDAAILARISDGALLVTQHGRTRREHVARAAEYLRSVDAQLLGTVLNKAPAREDSYGYYTDPRMIPRSATFMGADPLPTDPRS